MQWPIIGTTNRHAQLKIPDEDCKIKVIVCNGWDLKPLELRNSVALGCYQPWRNILTGN